MKIEHDDDAMTVTLPGDRQFLVSVYVSDLDATPVVQIDTTPDTGRLRVQLNDAESPLWDGDTDTKETTGV